MTQLAFAVPGSLDTPTGGYRYDRRVIAELRAAGHEVTLVTLPGSFPEPTDPDRATAEALIAALPAGMPVIIDGLALAVMDGELARIGAHRTIVALIHHPLALETGLAPARAQDLAASERRALALAGPVIVTSAATARSLVADFGVDAGRISVAVPGTDLSPRSEPPPRPPFRFISVGSLIPRKGHLDLVAALAEIADLDWTADIAGDAGLAPDHAVDLAARIAASGLSDRIRLIGVLDEADLSRAYHSAHCFVLASQYEGFGMAYTEAIAHGLATIGTTGGAIPDAIGAGGVMVAPGDVPALAAALRRVVSDPGHYAELCARAARRAGELPSWADTARVVARVLEAGT